MYSDSDFASKRADIDRRRIELEEQRWSEEKKLRREEMRARSKDVEQAGRNSMITELIKAGYNRIFHSTSPARRRYISFFLYFCPLRRLLLILVLIPIIPLRVNYVLKHNRGAAPVKDAFKIRLTSDVHPQFPQVCPDGFSGSLSYALPSPFPENAVN
ncbi:hypothetical protein PsorP6_017569 [Peronosclerospora sorghi]|uniref:Uncharacterized protein n=1 Tax=Peronosclerospora sorghi TaxID=230839 RepID=A0ACC0WL83_9STRA|nr:hypothetical protein PsorP6_017569 [Peronosclerospora sorghi]